MSQSILPSSAKAVTTADWARFESFTTATQNTVAKSSRRVYASLYHSWAAWCEAQGTSPLDLRPANVLGFIANGDTATSTRHMQFSALRSLAMMVATLEPSPANQANYNGLKLSRVPKASAKESNRQIRAISPDDVNKLLDAWPGPQPLDRRNRALIALLFATALRRSEAAALRWTDLNLIDGTLIVRHGKGDKFREVAIVGNFAAPALLDWRRALGIKRAFVFCPITPRGRIGQDRAINAQGVYRAVVHTEVITGIRVRPHDARRTHITDALEGGAALADVSAQAGHAQGATTLRYAHPVDAKRRRAKLKLNYGHQKGN